VSTFLLLQRFEFFPEAALSEARSRSMFALEDLDLWGRNGKVKFGELQEFVGCYPSINAGSCDPGGVEWMAKIHDCSGSLHHRIPLVVLDELAKRSELLAATYVVLVVLESEIECQSLE
jgi:hypothetical protein